MVIVQRLADGLAGHGDANASTSGPASNRPPVSGFAAVTLVVGIDHPRAITSRKTGKDVEVASLALADRSRSLLQTTLWAPKTSWAEHPDAAPRTGTGADAAAAVFGVYPLPLRIGDVILITDLQANRWRAGIEGGNSAATGSGSAAAAAAAVDGKVSGASQVLVLARDGVLAPAVAAKLAGTPVQAAAAMPLPVWCLSFLQSAAASASALASPFSSPAALLQERIDECLALLRTDYHYLYKGARYAGVPSGQRPGSAASNASSAAAASASASAGPHTPTRKGSLGRPSASIARSPGPTGPTTIIASLASLLDVVKALELREDAGDETAPSGQGRAGAGAASHVSLLGRVLAVRDAPQKLAPSTAVPSTVARKSRPRALFALQQSLASPIWVDLSLSSAASSLLPKAREAAATGLLVILTGCMIAAPSQRFDALLPYEIASLFASDTTDIVSAGHSLSGSAVPPPSLSPFPSPSRKRARVPASVETVSNAIELLDNSTGASTSDTASAVPFVRVAARVTGILCPSASLSVRCANEAAKKPVPVLEGGALLSAETMADLVALVCSNCGSELEVDDMGIVRCDRLTCLAVPDAETSSTAALAAALRASGARVVSEPQWVFRDLWLRLADDGASLRHQLWVQLLPDVLSQLLLGVSAEAVAKSLHSRNLLHPRAASCSAQASQHTAAMASQAASQFGSVFLYASMAQFDEDAEESDGAVVVDAHDAVASLLQALVHPRSAPLELTLVRSLASPLEATMSDPLVDGEHDGGDRGPTIAAQLGGLTHLSAQTVCTGSSSRSGVRLCVAASEVHLQGSEDA
jgi:hypothetical protein